MASSSAPLQHLDDFSNTAAEASSSEDTTRSSNNPHDASMDQADPTIEQEASQAALSSGNASPNISPSITSFTQFEPFVPGSVFGSSNAAAPTILLPAAASSVSSDQSDLATTYQPTPAMMGFLQGFQGWASTLLPHEFDEQTQSMSYAAAEVQVVEPYLDLPWMKQKGGSGILDTEPATHLYIQPNPLAPNSWIGDNVEAEDDREHFVADELSHLSLSGDEDESDLGLGSWEVDDDGSSADTRSPHSLPVVIPAAITIRERSDHPYAAFEPFPAPVDSNSTLETQQTANSSVLEVPPTDTSSPHPGLLWYSQDGDAEELSFEKDLGTLPFFNCSNSSLAYLLKPLENTMPEEPHVKRAPEFKVLILLEDGGIARINMFTSLVCCLPGKPMQIVTSWSSKNLSEFCWKIILNHHIRHVIIVKDGTVVNPAEFSSIHAINRHWIYRFANRAMQTSFPKVDHYFQIQALCDLSKWAIQEPVIEFLYSSLPKLLFHYLFAEPLAPCNFLLEEVMANGVLVGVDDTRNLTVSQLIKRLYLDRKMTEAQLRRPGERLWFSSELPHSRVQNDEAAMVDEWEVSEHIAVPEDFNHYRATFDLQQIDWERRVGVAPDDVREIRDGSWIDFQNIGGLCPRPTPQLEEKLNAANFVPKAMHTAYKASGPHFQLRNLMAAKSHVSLVYASDRGQDHGKVFQLMPWSSDKQARKCIIDLSKTSNETIYSQPVRITCVALSSEPARNLCMVGGFGGEYAMRALHSTVVKPVVGLATCARGGIINHIDLDFTTLSGAHHAVLACNDNKIRILDCETNTFLHYPAQPDKYRISGESSGHRYPWPINCTATSPDGRLRVVVGDTPDVIIVNAETGYCERLLKGHSDYGFACAWAPDGVTVATANQDKLVNIYDARTWRILEQFESPGPGPFMSMKYSPVGGGTRCLLLAEAADRVTVVNAHNYVESQTHSFYGEISGIDFQNDGSSFWVANSDQKFGGMMEFERRGYGQPYGLHFQRRREIEENLDEYREEGAEEWIYDHERYDDERCADPGRDGPMGRRDLFGTNFILPGLRDT